MSFTLYPAIDLLDGKGVRLVHGDYAQATVYADDPVAAAARFYRQGAEWLHIVDLDGAKAGRPVNASVIEAIAAALPLHLEVGGGIRTIETVDYYLAHGVSRVVLGSSAISDPVFTREALRLYPQNVAVGLDAKNGKIAVEGWLKLSSLTPAELALELMQFGAEHFIYTDIARDGAMEGANVEAACQLARMIGRPVVLSGGVHALSELKAITARGDALISGAIIGKALYAGAFDLAEAIKAVNDDAR
ncbi:MAG: 1-(5-phosphoribosyl)-5-[(5-phosphoribosylamino)methylideneamino]imidazole-4-carboxamide isomerase [Sporolactobacillus sp.]